MALGTHKLIASHLAAEFVEHQDIHDPTSSHVY